jgi:hypothetical protein
MGIEAESISEDGEEVSYAIARLRCVGCEFALTSAAIRMSLQGFPELLLVQCIVVVL